MEESDYVVAVKLAAFRRLEARVAELAERVDDNDSHLTGLGAHRRYGLGRWLALFRPNKGVYSADGTRVIFGRRCVVDDDATNRSLNEPKREERDRSPIVTLQTPESETGDALKPYIPLDLMGLAHDVIDAAIALTDFWRDVGVSQRRPLADQDGPGARLERAVDRYREVNQ